MVPLNVSLRGDGLKYIINHCDASRIVVHERLKEAYEFVEKDLKRIVQKIWIGEALPPPSGFTPWDALWASLAAPLNVPSMVMFAPGSGSPRRPGYR